MLDIGDEKGTMFVGSKAEVSQTIQDAYARGLAEGRGSMPSEAESYAAGLRAGLAEGRAKGLDEAAEMLPYKCDYIRDRVTTSLRDRAAEIRKGEK